MNASLRQARRDPDAIPTKGKTMPLLARARRKVKDKDAFDVGDALDPKKNPFTFGEWHYFAGGLAIGFIMGMVFGQVVVYLLVKALGG